MIEEDGINKTGKAKKKFTKKESTSEQLTFYIKSDSSSYSKDTI